MADYLKNTLLTADSDVCNSLEGIIGYADQDIALVQQQNRWFRFFAANTTAPDGESVIAPANITPPDPGRWIRQGPPGPVGPNPKKPVSLACDSAGIFWAQAEVATTGATGATPIQEIIDLAATFPKATYQTWNGFASHVESQTQTNSVRLQTQLFQLDEISGTGEWQLRVAAWPDAGTPVEAGEIIRITMLPPGNAP